MMKLHLHFDLKPRENTPQSEKQIISHFDWVYTFIDASSSLMNIGESSNSKKAC